MKQFRPVIYVVMLVCGCINLMVGFDLGRPLLFSIGAICLAWSSWSIAGLLLKEEK